MAYRGTGFSLYGPSSLFRVFDFFILFSSKLIRASAQFAAGSLSLSLFCNSLPFYMYCDIFEIFFLYCPILGSVSVLFRIYFYFPLSPFISSCLGVVMHESLSPGMDLFLRRGTCGLKTVSLRKRGYILYLLYACIFFLYPTSPENKCTVFFELFVRYWERQLNGIIHFCRRLRTCGVRIESRTV